jgi:anti-sigma regulatory factor (Ser/Thr protein kinase)
VKDAQYWSYVGDAVDEARRVRRDVRCFLEGQADVASSDLDGAELVVGELVANAVLHGAPPFGVCVDWTDDPPVLCVVDRGAGMSPVYPAPGPDSETGRGLLIVRALAGELTIDTTAAPATGTRVVVSLPVHRRRVEGPQAA